MAWIDDALAKAIYEKKISSLRKRVASINSFFSVYENEFAKSGNKLSFFSDQTNRLREDIKSYVAAGMSEKDALDVVLDRAYGLVKLAVKTKFGKTYYDEQLMGAILLNEGHISEMATGEGKTLTAILPTYLNAIMGRGAHVITPNDYLAKRDFEENKPLYELLGLSVGLVENKNNPARVQEDMSVLDVLQEVEKVKAEVAKIKSPRERRKKYDEEVAKIKAKAESKTPAQPVKIDNRPAYKADITYGSAQVFAFDYLNDALDNDPTTRITRYGKPNFAVIDEADAVLFDDARSSYRISGDQMDKKVGLSQEEKIERQRNIQLAGLVMDFINRNGYMMEVDNYERYTNNTNFAVYYSEQPKGFVKNGLFDAIAFSIFDSNKVGSILNRNQAEIMNYLDNREYYVQNGRFNVTPIGMFKLIENRKVDELQVAYDDFLKRYPSIDLDNAINAWTLLKEGKDYILTNSKKGPPYKDVNIVINGRTEEGRKYGNGLHQAVEVKEMYQQAYKNSGIQINPSDLNDTLSTITVSSFYARYERLSGMTGTSCKSAFENLYGRETYKVPTHRPRNVDNLGEKVLPTKEGKYQAILDELLVSVRKGQPVLISTTSVSESEALRDYLQKELRKVSNRFEKIPVLNAKLDKLAEEANIISKAGVAGAITIATEMAGRGTDIKLGGESATPEEKARIESLGGLKVICDGHFSYDRVDRQVVGRTGRQGNKGEYCFISDYEDLSRIGIDERTIDKLRNDERELARDASKNRTYMKALKDAQATNEALTESSIKFEHLFEAPASMCRGFYIGKKEQLTQSGDYKKFIEDSMEFVAEQMINHASEKTVMEPERQSLSSLYIDKNELRKEYGETFGLALPDEVFERCKTAQDLITIMANLGKDELRYSTINTESVDTHINRVWYNFESGVEDIKNQYRASAITNTGDILKNYENTVVQAFYDSYHSELCEIIDETIGMKRKATYNAGNVNAPKNEESAKTGKHM